MTNTRKYTLEEALKTPRVNYADKYGVSGKELRKAISEANKRYFDFYKQGKRYTNGVDTIEVKAVETDCSGFYQDIHFSVIAENDEELLGFSWMEEVTEEEYPAEPFEESYWVLAEMGFTKEI